MDSMPMLDDDFNYNEINLDFLVSPPRLKANATTVSYKTETNLNSLTFQEKASTCSGSQVTPIVHEEIKVEKTEAEILSLDFLDSPKKEKRTATVLSKYLRNEAPPIVKEEIKFEKTEAEILSLDFLDSPKKKRTATVLSQSLQQDSYNADIVIKTEKQSNTNSKQTLAKRIAKVDTLVRQLKTAEEEKIVLQKQMEDFNQNAKEIQLLYNSERSARIKAEQQYQALRTQCDHLETEMAAKSLELDQVHAQMEDCNGPVLYSELAVRFLKLAQKLDEERLLHWHDQPLFKDIAKYCKEKNLKVPKITPRSPPKRKTTMVRKADSETQCELLVPTVAATEETEKTKIQQRNQSTQCERTETRNQGCQHIGTTTTRSTTTSCFFKYHDVGTNCSQVDFEPAFNDILEEMRTFGDRFVSPLSPIADVWDEDEITPMSPPLPPLETVSIAKDDTKAKETLSIGVNTEPPCSAERKTVGCCTYICNVQRVVDFVAQTPFNIKRSESRPPSTSLPFETIKDELPSRSTNVSPVNFNLNLLNNLMPPIAPTLPPQSSSILPHAFDELWQIFGHMLYGLLNRRLSFAGGSADASATPNNITNQQSFYNWLHAAYNNTQQTSQHNLHQSANLNEPASCAHHDISQPSRSNQESEPSINRSTTLPSTPLSFSDAAPTSQTVPNVLKPTALRKNLKDTLSNEESNTCSETTTNRKSIATSPIRCINTAALKFNEERFSKESHTPIGNNEVARDEQLVFEKAATEQCKESLTLTEMKHSETPILKRLNKKSHTIKKPKSSKLRNSCLKEGIAETAVEFLARRPHELKEQKNQSTQHNLIADSSLPKEPHREMKLQQLSNALFGSESETEAEIDDGGVETVKNDCSDSSSESLSGREVVSSSCSSSSSSCSSCETCQNHSFTSDDSEPDEQSLQIIEDVSEEQESEDKMLSKNVSEMETNESNRNKIIAVVQAQPLADILAQDSCSESDNFDTTTESEQCTAKNDVSPKKRGRKRGLSTTSPQLLPSKRSARLLVKQTNQQIKSNVQPKQLTLMALDFNNEISPNSNSKPNKPSKASKESSAEAIKNVSMSNENVKNEALSTRNHSAYNLNEAQNTTAPEISAFNAALHLKNAVKTLDLPAPLNLFKGFEQKILKTEKLFPSSDSSTSNFSKTAANAIPSSKIIALRTANISPLYKSPYTLQHTNMNTIAPHSTKRMINEQNSLTKTCAQKPAAESPELAKICLEKSVATPKAFFYTTKTDIRPTAAATLKSVVEANVNIMTPKEELNSKGCVQSCKETETLISTPANAAQQNFNGRSATALYSTTSNTNPTASLIADAALVSNQVAVSNHTNHVNFTSPPASPVPFENQQIQAAAISVKEIPLELSTWRHWGQQQRRSLLHNLISAYDSKLYQGFQGNEWTEHESKKVVQLAALINEFLKQTMAMQTNPSTIATVELAIFQLLEKLLQIASEAKLLAQAILMSMQKQQRPLTPAYDHFVDGTPTMGTTNTAALIYDPLTNQSFTTHAHRCCAYVLERMPNDILRVLLQLIESSLFNIKSADSLPLYDALNLTDLYLLALKTVADSSETNPARLFIAKCLYYHKLKASPMIYAVLSAFPTVLPHREERRYDRSDALITVIQHCLMCNMYDMNNSELLQRELLSKLRFQYHFEAFKPDFNEVLTNLVEKLCAGKSENLKFAFAILCKRLPPERVVRDVVQQHFIPLANEYYRLTEQNAAYEARLATLLNCFSTVIKPFPRDPSAPHAAVSNEISNYLNFFKRFLPMVERPLVQEAAIHAILRLQRFDFVNCYQALAHLRIEFELQPNTRAALKTFIYRKPYTFWKAILLQNR